MNQTIIFPNLHIELHHVGKSISVFGFEIAFYGIIIALGMLLAVTWILHEVKRTHQKEDDYLDLCIWTIIFSVIGARLYYVIFSWDLYRDDLLGIFRLREGGLAIYGGIIAGVIIGFVIAKKKKIPFLKMADTVIPGLLIGQIMGRWGNFFNREAFGGYSDGLFAMQLPMSEIRSMSDVTEEMLSHIVLVQGEPFISVHPTFLYESLWNLALFALLLWYRKRKKKDGEVFFLYLLGYGLGRFWIEGLRTDQLLLWNTQVAISQIVAVVLIVISVIWFLVTGVKKRAK